jgi:hypothetical protein
MKQLEFWTRFFTKLDVFLHLFFLPTRFPKLLTSTASVTSRTWPSPPWSTGHCQSLPTFIPLTSDRSLSVRTRRTLSRSSGTWQIPGQCMPSFIGKHFHYIFSLRSNLNNKHFQCFNFFRGLTSQQRIEMLGYDRFINFKAQDFFIIFTFSHFYRFVLEYGWDINVSTLNGAYKQVRFLFNLITIKCGSKILL